MLQKLGFGRQSAQHVTKTMVWSNKALPWRNWCYGNFCCSSAHPFHKGTHLHKFLQTIAFDIPCAQNCNVVNVVVNVVVVVFIKQSCRSDFECNGNQYPCLLAKKDSSGARTQNHSLNVDPFSLRSCDPIIL